MDGLFLLKSTNSLEKHRTTKLNPTQCSKSNYPDIDVCIVCALPEEKAYAVNTIGKHCKCTFTKTNFEHCKANFFFDFAHTTNNLNESICIGISCATEVGGNHMQALVTAILSELSPRLIIMTGICAGDKKTTTLGDIIISKRAFLADDGKITYKDGTSEVTFKHDIKTYGTTFEMMRYINDFQWKQDFKLKRPPLIDSVDGANKSKREPIKHISAITATFSAVQGADPFDDPFYSIRHKVRSTCGLEMEAYHFYFAAEPFAGITKALVIKGVADYADSQKDDRYHKFASSASALFALLFIKQYLTSGYMPKTRLDESHSAFFYKTIGSSGIIIDDTGRSYSIPLAFPQINAVDYSQLALLPKDWKTIHTATEILYKSLRDIPKALDDLIDNFDKDLRHKFATTTENLIRSFSDELNRFADKISIVDEAIKNQGCVNVILDLKKCIIPLLRVIGEESNRNLLIEAYRLVNQMCALILELLTRADRMLEVYFANHHHQ